MFGGSPERLNGAQILLLLVQKSCVHQLRLIVSPITYRVLAPSQVVSWISEPSTVYRCSLGSQFQSRIPNRQCWGSSTRISMNHPTMRGCSTYLLRYIYILRYMYNGICLQYIVSINIIYDALVCISIICNHNKNSSTSIIPLDFCFSSTWLKPSWPSFDLHLLQASQVLFPSLLRCLGRDRWNTHLIEQETNKQTDYPSGRVKGCLYK